MAIVLHNEGSPLVHEYTINTDAPMYNDLTVIITRQHVLLRGRSTEDIRIPADQWAALVSLVSAEPTPAYKLMVDGPDGLVEA